MSDLISRSEMIRAIEEHYINLTNDNVPRSIPDFYSEIQKLVYNQPTAFDTEKVVEQLEEKTDFLKDCTKYGNKDAKQQEKSYSTMMMYEVADLVDDLIEIVNQLAEEYNNDFCEWKDGAIGIFHIKTSCGHSIDVNYGYEFCPYCGKKIKVAPYQPKGE